MNNNTAYGGYTAWIDLGEEDKLNGLPIDIATNNPLALLEFTDDKSDVQRLLANVQFDYQFHNIPELRANLNMGYDMSKSDGHDILDPKASWSYRDPQDNVKAYKHTLKNSLLDFNLNYNH